MSKRGRVDDVDHSSTESKRQRVINYSCDTDYNFCFPQPYEEKDSSSDEDSDDEDAWKNKKITSTSWSYCQNHCDRNLTSGVLRVPKIKGLIPTDKRSFVDEKYSTMEHAESTYNFSDKLIMLRIVQFLRDASFGQLRKNPKSIEQICDLLIEHGYVPAAEQLIEQKAIKPATLLIQIGKKSDTTTYRVIKNLATLNHFISSYNTPSKIIEALKNYQTAVKNWIAQFRNFSRMMKVVEKYQHRSFGDYIKKLVDNYNKIKTNLVNFCNSPNFKSPFKASHKEMQFFIDEKSSSSGKRELVVNEAGNPVFKYGERKIIEDENLNHLYNEIYNNICYFQREIVDTALKSLLS